MRVNNSATSDETSFGTRRLANLTVGEIEPHPGRLYLTQMPQTSTLPPHLDAINGARLDRLRNRYLNETVFPRSLALATLQMVNRRCRHLCDHDFVAVEHEHHYDLSDRGGRPAR